MNRILAGLLLLLSSETVLAAPFQVGECVATIRATRLTTRAISGRTDAARIAVLEPGVVLKIEQVNGGRVWVSDVQAGYVDGQDLRRLPEARVLFTDEIAKSRFYGDAYLYRGNVLLALGEVESAHRARGAAHERQMRASFSGLRMA